MPPPSSEIELADLSRLRIRAPDEAEIEAFKKVADEVRSRTVRAKIGAKVAKLADQEANRNWESSAEARNWQELVRAASPSDTGWYRTALTGYLSGLACKALFTDGSVAYGVARRALGKAFRGDVAEIRATLTSPRCAASGTLPEDVKMQLRVSAEAAAPAGPGTTAQTGSDATSDPSGGSTGTVQQP